MAFTDLAAGFAPQSIQTLDLQYQAMTGVQATWGFPQLPNEVTVDLLAEPQLPTPESQEEFLYGLANDLEQSTRPRIDIPQLEIARSTPAIQGPAAQVPGKFQAEDAFVQSIRSKFSAVAGVRAPEIIVSDPDHAVLDLKRRAIEAGYLPEDTALDGSWSPGLNRVRRNILDDDFKKTLSGDEFGSTSLEKVLEQVDRWASPGSLLMTTLGMDMLPNLGKIGEEFDNWGDNAKAWLSDPFDLGKFGKALGPVDDILFPALNLYLTFTGFRSLMVFGKALRGVSAAGAGMGRLRGLSGVVPLEEMMRMSRPGIIGKQLSKRGLPGGQAAENWRRTSSVLMTKKAVQQGMKVGFVGEIENELTPHRSGFSILGQGGTADDRIQKFKDFRTVTPIGMAVSTALDIPFAPTSMLAPGAITGKVKRIGKPLQDRLIGLDQDKTISVAFTTTLLDALDNSAPHADRVARARALVKQNKVEDASAVLLTGAQVVDDAVREKSGMLKMFLVGSAALHKAATAAAEATGAAAGTTKFKRTYHAMRNHFISRLRPFDFDEIDMDDPEQLRFFMDVHSGVLGADVEVDDLGNFLAGQKPAKSTAIKGRAKHREQLAAGIEDGTVTKEWIDGSIAHHMDLRNGTYNDLLDGLNEGDLSLYLQGTFETLDNWDSWTGSNQFLQEWASEPDSVLKYIKPRGFEAKWEPSGIESDLLGKMLPNKMGDNRSFNKTNPLQTNLDSGEVAVNVARLETPTKQDVILLARRLKRLVKLKAASGRVPEGQSLGVIDETYRQSLLDFAASKNKPLSDLKKFELEEWRDSLLSPGQRKDPSAPRSFGAGGSLVGEKEMLAYGRAVRTMDREGFKTFDEGLQFVDEQLEAVRNSEFWNRLRIDRMHIDDVSHGRMKTDEELITELERAKEFVAAELDVPPEVKQRLADDGYKAVAGREFMYDSDLIGIDSPFSDIVRRDLKKRSLGLFFSRTDNTASQITALRRTQTASELAREVNAMIRSGAWDGPTEGFDWANPTNQAYDNILSMLYDRRAQLQSTALAGEADAVGITSTVGTRMKNSGLPYTVNDLRKKDVARALNGDPDLLPPGQKPLYGKAAVNAITSALRKGKVLPFERAGLGMLQDKLVSTSWLRQGLNVFRYSEAADDAGFMNGVQRAAKVVGVGRSANAPRAELDMWRTYQHMGGAMFGAALGYAQTGDPLVAAASGVAGGVEGNPSAGMFARNMVRSQAFILGAQAGAAGGMSDNNALLTGAAAATGGMGIFRGAMTAAGTPAAKLAKSWSTYSTMGDAMIRERDRVRFALSPIFDIQRYTEGMVLAATADLDLPITTRPMHHAQKLTGMSKSQILDQYKTAGNTAEWIDAVESGQAWFYERGLMGFAPTEWMASTHARLVHNGWDSAQAADKVKDIYTYGLKGRSGLEQSVNFVFFPFSFQKKYLGAVGKFMADDIGRAMVMHDSLKMLEIVSEKYDLKERYRDKLPILDQLRKVNSVAYGISPGQLGGINRPYLDLIRSSPGTADAYDSIVNIFLPQALEIQSEGDMENLKYNMRRVLPIMRDVQDLHEDIMEQGHVITSPSHSTRREEARQGWEEYNNLRQKMNDAAKQAGISPAAVYRGQGAYAGVRQLYDNEIAEIGKRFPHWQESRIQASQRAVRKSAEIRDIVRTPETPAEVAMSQFDALVKRGEQTAGLVGGDFMYNADLVPPEFMTYLRQEAVELAIAVPGFDTFYRMYYQDMLGPIHQKI